MTTTLRLEAFKLPFRPKGTIRRCLTDPTRLYLGLLTDEGLHVLSYRDGLANPVRFSLPAASRPRAMRANTVQLALFGQIVSLPLPRVADPPPIALHPLGNQVALVTDGEVTLLGLGGQAPRTIYTFTDDARVKGAVFGCSGEVLWVSREFPQDMRRLALPNPWHEVLAFALPGGQLLGRAAVRGDVQSGHTLAAHPTQETVAVEVSCGQDGSWITFASLQAGQVISLAEQIDGDSEPFSLAGFAPDGDALITTGESDIQEFLWPSAQYSARARAKADEDEGEDEFYFGWNGAYVGQYFLGLAEGEDDTLLRAFVCPGLRPVDQLVVKSTAQQVEGTLYGLGPDTLIADGSGGLRAWRVTGK